MTRLLFLKMCITFGNLSDLYSGNANADIHDSYIIFDIRNHPDRTNFYVNGSLVDKLRAIFSTWQENENRILFICNADEEIWTDEDHVDEGERLLDYVDLHVDTDTFSFFVANVFFELMAVRGSNSLFNTTIILDASFSEDEDLTDGPIDNWLYDNFIAPIVKDIHNYQLGNSLSVNTYFSAHNIKLLYYVGNNTFTNIANSCIYNIDDLGIENFYSQFAMNEYIITMGNTESGEQLTDEWIVFLDGLLAQNEDDEEGNTTVLNFMYSHNGTDVDLEETYIKWFGDREFLLQQEWGFIVETFIYDRDTIMCDNWNGICYSTYKTIIVGEGGWLNNIGNLINSIPDWKITRY